MGAENEGNFKCVKIFLLILYILSLIGTIIFVILSIVGMVVVGKAKPKDEQEELTLEIAKNLIVVALVSSIIGMIVSVMGVYGVIKENKPIMITMTVLYVIAFVFHAVTGSIFQAIWSIFVAIMTGYFAKKIIDKQKMSFENSV